MTFMSDRALQAGDVINWDHDRLRGRNALRMLTTGVNRVRPVQCVDHGFRDFVLPCARVHSSMSLFSEYRIPSGVLKYSMHKNRE